MHIEELKKIWGCFGLGGGGCHEVATSVNAGGRRSDSVKTFWARKGQKYQFIKTIKICQLAQYTHHHHGPWAGRGFLRLVAYNIGGVWKLMLHGGLWSCWTQLPPPTHTTLHSPDLIGGILSPTSGVCSGSGVRPHPRYMGMDVHCRENPFDWEIPKHRTHAAGQTRGQALTRTREG